jgi:hypothetical protein
MLASSRTEEIFSLAAGVAAALERATAQTRTESKNRRLRVSPTWVKWSGTHQDRSLACSETVLGVSPGLRLLVRGWQALDGALSGVWRGSARVVVLVRMVTLPTQTREN